MSSPLIVALKGLQDVAAAREAEKTAAETVNLDKMAEEAVQIPEIQDTASQYKEVKMGQKRGDGNQSLPPTGSFSQDAIGKQKLAEINELEARGLLRPDTAALMRQKMGLSLESQGLSQGDITAQQNLEMAQGAPETFNAINQGFQQAGLQPLEVPVPLNQPVVAPEIQDTVQRELAQQESNERQAAQQVEAAQAQHAANLDVAAQNKVQSLDNQAQKAGPDWLGAIGQAVAIGLGEYGRQLTGGENLALKTIERIAKERAEKEKLTAEQQLAERKLALDEALGKLREEELKTDSSLKRAQIDKIRAEIEAEKGKTTAQRDILARMQSGQGFTAMEIHLLPEKDRERAVQLPNGHFQLAARAEDAKKVTEQINDIQEARTGLKRLKELSGEFGNNPLKKVIDRDAIAEADTLQRAIIGKMRLQLFGPGVLTDTEQRLAAGIVRNPSALLTLASANEAAFNTLQQKLDFSYRQRLRSAGVNLPPSKNEINIQKIKADPRFKGITDAEAASQLIQKGRWEEEI